VPEFVLFPKEFFASTEKSDPLLYFLYPECGVDRIEGPLWCEGIDTGKPLIYCALGSQASIVADVRSRVFGMLVDVMRSLSNYQFFVAAGRNNLSGIRARGPNIIVTEWAPQIAVLARASAMITHGGSGSVRECISAGVPMLVVPMMRDQFWCAEAVAKHGLGISIDINRATPREMESSLQRLIKENVFVEKVRRIRESWRTEGWTLAVDVMEAASSRHKSAVGALRQVP
jgi:zeaxanthin glucosyltransferase